MTTNDDQPASGAPHELTRSERTFVKIYVWQTVLSLAGLFIGVLALYAALTESEAVRRQTSAAVWPYVQLTMNDFARDDSGLFELSLSNAGVGPADIRDMHVTFAGRPMTSWRDLVLAISDGEPVEFSQTVANHRVLRPGESVTIFSTTDLQLVAPLRSAVADPSNAIEYCYCSIFNECWIANSRNPNARPTPVDACRNYGNASFTN